MTTPPPIDAAVAGPDAASPVEAAVAADSVPSTPADARWSEDTGPAPDRAISGAAGPQTVLVYTRATGFVHDSIGATAATVGAALRAAGVTVEASADPAVFTPERLGRYAAVVLVSTTGKPLGDPGTAALDALAAFVRGGGALVGLHAASSTFYDPALPYTALIGGRFVDHPGGVRSSICHPARTHPAVAQLPPAFPVHDEIYDMDHLDPANVIDLRCNAVSGPPLPISWHRDEGMGRVFYTALGHDRADWAADSMLVTHHVMPGIFWALGR
jgi:type 1 glutamine amidotransferase